MRNFLGEKHEDAPIQVDHNDPHSAPIVARLDLAGLVALGLAPQSLNDHGAAGLCHESTNQFPILSLLGMLPK
jgi:hypothetical protein